jgi:hypothetical protein
MRKMLASFALLGLIALVTMDANAQRPGPGFRPGASLITNKSVQDELKMTDEQKEKADEKSKALFTNLRDIIGKVKDLPKEERMEKMQKMMKEQSEKLQKELAAILKPEQTKRLKQIERQQNALNTMTSDEEAVKELKVTDEQKEKLKGISDQLNKDLRELKGGAVKGDFREAMEKQSAARKEASEKAVKVLTTDQQDKWKDMTGAPFTVKQEPFGFPKKPIDK